MTKSELVMTVSGAADIPPTIVLPGFGTFSRKHREARTCRNPNTGESMEVPECDVASFKPGKRMKDAVNGG